MRTQQYLISARFFFTMGHLIMLLILFGTIRNNIEAGLGDNASASEKSDAEASSMAALVIGVICFCLDFSGMLLGTTLFYSMGNLMHILFHFMGSILLSWLVTEIWSYKTLWPIVICCNLPTALYEIAMLLAVFVFRIVIY